MRGSKAIGITFLLMQFFFIENGLCSTGGISNFGAGLSGFSSSRSVREMVQLEKRGDFLIGHPQNPSIELIVVFAPGAKDAKIILRELDSSEGGKTFLVSGPKSLETRVRRLTIFLQRGTKQLVLLNLDSEKHIIHHPYAVPHSSSSDQESDHQDLLAFTLREFGLLWVGPISYVSINEEGLGSVKNSEDLSLAGDLTTGMFNWGFAFFFLGIGWLVSILTHSIEQRKEESRP